MVDEEIKSVVEYFNRVDEALSDIPDHKKDKQKYKEWKEKVNKLIEECHQLAGYKIYNKVK